MGKDGLMSLNLLYQVDQSAHFHSQTPPREHESNGPFTIVRGEGIWLTDSAGKSYLEGVSGLWCASLGFSNERVAAVAAAQLSKLGVDHTFNHRTNEPAAELVGMIRDMSPLDNSRVFLASSGSEANDTMIKLAWRYQLARGKPTKRKIISRDGAFHGSTVMGATLSGLTHMQQAFNLPDTGVVHVRKPHFYREGFEGETPEAFATRLAAELEAQILVEGADTIAAMIAEPIMGAAGMIPPPPGYFPKIQAVLDRYDILLLADEVICGFGRTGEWFGSQTCGFVPDMMSLSKGLSAGFLPVSAVVLSGKIYEAVADESQRVGGFGHGYTASGHPVTTAVAVEVQKIYREMDIVGEARRLGAHLEASLLDHLGNHPLVGEIRLGGLMAGIEIVADRFSKTSFPPAQQVGTQIAQQTRRNGALIRNVGDSLVICPPFIIKPAEIDTLVERVRNALDDLSPALTP